MRRAGHEELFQSQRRLLCEVGEGVVESVKCLVRRDGKVHDLICRQVTDVDTRAVVVGVPVQRDFEPVVRALGELATSARGECRSRHQVLLSE